MEVNILVKGNKMETEFEKKIEEIFEKILRDALDMQRKVYFVLMAILMLFGFALGFITRGIFWR